MAAVDVLSIRFEFGQLRALPTRHSVGKFTAMRMIGGFVILITVLMRGSKHTTRTSIYRTGWC
jgi:hypothetical protein